MPFARLDSRALLSLHGVDAARFLQGIISNSVPTAGAKYGFYSGVFTGKGRVLHDVFVYPTNHSRQWRDSVKNPDEPGYLLECDRTVVEDAYKYLRIFKLRSKFEIRRVDAQEYGVHALWDESHPEADHIGCVDPRTPTLGSRVVLPANATPDVKRASFEEYTMRRMLQGVAEGQKEIIGHAALPMEANMDYMSGIDFHKGCYVGQELTIRTHHQGVVRKRIVPVQLYDLQMEPPPALTPVTSSSNNTYYAEKSEISRVAGAGRPPGHFLAGIANIGLALVRLEVVKPRKPGNESPSSSSSSTAFKALIQGQEKGLAAFQPDWWPSEEEAKHP